MNKEQIYKLFKVAIVTTFIMLICEIIFSISAVNNFFSSLITNANGIVVYLIIWLIMFLQVTIINIPAYVILSTSISVGIVTLSWQYLLTVLSACMAGVILAYWLGRWFGVKAVKWAAGSQEDFDKWSKFLNKKGKWYYFLSVLFPIFPDDLLCLVAGGIKFNFGFFLFSNTVGRGIGLITMLLTLQFLGFIGGGFPFMIIVWALALLAEIIALIIIKKKLAKNS